jgi:hypothetical protein
VGSFSVIRPQDDNVAQQASAWCDELVKLLSNKGHSLVNDTSATSPGGADKKDIVAAISSRTDLICYFGHGDEKSWLTLGSSTVDASDFQVAKGKAVVSIACKTGRVLGPDAVTAGAVSWLGFTIKVVVVPLHKTVDHLGDAIVDGLAVLGTGGTVQQARDELAAKLDQLMVAFDTGGTLSSHPSAGLGYLSSMALRDHISLEGQNNHRPLP